VNIQGINYIGRNIWWIWHPFPKEGGGRLCQTSIQGSLWQVGHFFQGNKIVVQDIGWTPNLKKWDNEWKSIEVCQPPEEMGQCTSQPS
jgi:hypothetical protein